MHCHMHSPCSLTSHWCLGFRAHRCLAFRNSTPDILSAFSARLTTLLRVCVSRVASASASFPCPRSSLTHTHRFLGSRNSTTGQLPVFSARLMCILCEPDDRDSACVPAPSLSPRPPSSRSSFTHTNKFPRFPQLYLRKAMPAPTSAGSMYSNSMYDAQPSV